MYSGPGLLRLRLGVGPELQSIQVPLPVGAWARREAGQSVPVTAAPAGRPARLVCPSLGLRARASVSAALTRAAPLAVQAHWQTRSGGDRGQFWHPRGVRRRIGRRRPSGRRTVDPRLTGLETQLAESHQ